MLANNDLRVDAGLIDVAQHLDDVTDGAAGGGGPAGNFHDHHVARLRRRRSARGDLHLRRHAAIEGNHVTDAGRTGRISLEATDDRAVSALDDADDASFGPALGLALDSHEDAIAVHRFGEIGSGNVDVLRLFARLDEAETPGIGQETAGDNVLFLGEGEPVAADLHEVASIDKRLELPFEGDVLLAWHAQETGQLA